MQQKKEDVDAKLFLAGELVRKITIAYVSARKWVIIAKVVRTRIVVSAKRAAVKISVPQEA